MLFVLAWVACLCGWHRSCACVGDVLACVAWVTCERGWRDSFAFWVGCVACYCGWRGWHANVSDELLLLSLLLLKYYPEEKNVEDLLLKQK